VGQQVGVKTSRPSAPSIVAIVRPSVPSPPFVNRGNPVWFFLIYLITYSIRARPKPIVIQPQCAESTRCTFSVLDKECEDDKSRVNNTEQLED